MASSSEEDQIYKRKRPSFNDLDNLFDQQKYESISSDEEDNLDLQEIFGNGKEYEFMYSDSSDDSPQIKDNKDNNKYDKDININSNINMNDLEQIFCNFLHKNNLSIQDYKFIAYFLNNYDLNFLSLHIFSNKNYFYFKKIKKILEDFPIFFKLHQQILNQNFKINSLIFKNLKNSIEMKTYLHYLQHYEENIGILKVDHLVENIHFRENLNNYFDKNFFKSDFKDLISNFDNSNDVFVENVKMYILKACAHPFIREFVKNHPESEFEQYFYNFDSFYSLDNGMDKDNNGIDNVNIDNLDHGIDNVKENKDIYIDSINNEINKDNIDKDNKDNIKNNIKDNINNNIDIEKRKTFIHFLTHKIYQTINTFPSETHTSSSIFNKTLEIILNTSNKPRKFNISITEKKNKFYILVLDRELEILNHFVVNYDEVKDVLREYKPALIFFEIRNNYFKNVYYKILDSLSDNYDNSIDGNENGNNFNSIDRNNSNINSNTENNSNNIENNSNINSNNPNIDNNINIDKGERKIILIDKFFDNYNFTENKIKKEKNIFNNLYHLIKRGIYPELELILLFNKRIKNNFLNILTENDFLELKRSILMGIAFVGLRIESFCRNGELLNDFFGDLSFLEEIDNLEEIKNFYLDNNKNKFETIYQKREVNEFYTQIISFSHHTGSNTKNSINTLQDNPININNTINGTTCIKNFLIEKVLLQNIVSQDTVFLNNVSTYFRSKYLLDSLLCHPLNYYKIKMICAAADFEKEVKNDSTKNILNCLNDKKNILNKLNLSENREMIIFMLNFLFFKRVEYDGLPDRFVFDMVMPKVEFVRGRVIKVGQDSYLRILCSHVHSNNSINSINNVLDRDSNKGMNKVLDRDSNKIETNEMNNFVVTAKGDHFLNEEVFLKITEKNILNLTFKGIIIKKRKIESHPLFLDCTNKQSELILKNSNKILIINKENLIYKIKNDIFYYYKFEEEDDLDFLIYKIFKSILEYQISLEGLNVEFEYLKKDNGVFVRIGKNVVEISDKLIWEGVEYRRWEDLLSVIH